jgi:hypothetical protein
MHADQFETRLPGCGTALQPRSRARSEAVVSADHMSRSSDGVIKHVCESYRHLHGICGIGPTVGFTATGEAARAAEVALMQAYRESRGLTH